MSSIKNRVKYALLVAALTVILVHTVEATAMSFIVYAGQEETRTLSLAVEDRVGIRFTVEGRTTSQLDFYITDPDGNVMRERDSVSIVNYHFVCSEEGDYKLHFFNVDSTEEKLVSLDYEVQHYIFGMPQMLFLAVVVVCLCVGAVATFVFIAKLR